MSKNSEKAIIRNRCTGCGVCISKCPKNAIEFVTKDYIKRARVIEEICDGCRICIPFCQFNAIDVKKADI